MTLKKTGLFNSSVVYLIAALLMLVIFYATEYGTKKHHSDQHIKDRFQNSLKFQRANLIDKTKTITEILKDPEKNYWPSLERLLDPEQIFAQIYFEDSLIFWNSNLVQNDLDYLYEGELDTIIREKTAWYQVHFKSTGVYRVFLFKLIKAEYPFENKFLPSKANREFLSSDQVELTVNIKSAQYAIVNDQGVPVIGLTIIHHNDIGNNIILLLFFIYILFYILLVLWLNKLYNKYAHVLPGKRTAFLLFIIDLALLRWLDFYFAYPAVLKQSFLFEPGFDLIPGLNSIGDLYLTTILLIAVFIKFNKLVQREQINAGKKYRYLQHFVSLSVLWLLAYGVFYLDQSIISGLSTNPVIGIQFSDPINLLAVFINVLLNVVLFFMVRSMNYYSGKYSVSFLSKILFTVFLTIVFVTGFPSYHLIAYITSGFVVLILVVVQLFSENTQIRFIRYLIYLIIFAAANAVVINIAENKTKDFNQALTADYLAHKDDPELESIFHQAAQQVSSDSVVSLIIDNYWDNPEDALNEYLKHRYFDRIAFTYDIQVTVCMSGELLEIQPEGILVGCHEYFEDLIRDFGDSTSVNDLYLQNSTPESIYYIGVIKPPALKHTDEEPLVYIEFYFTYVPEGVGYPELLVDNSTLTYDLSGYSFAKYINNNLVYKFGDFAYHTEYSSQSDFPANEFYNDLNYRHLKLVSADGDVLIISRPIAKIQEKLATFSILFLLMGAVAFLIFILVFRSDVFAVFMLSFRTRLQVFFIITISVIIFVIALITAYYAEYNNKERVITQLNEKTYSVLIELQHKLGGITSPEQIKTEELYPLLRKFSLVFFSDINMYDPSGKLIATSRPEVFRTGLLSELINPLAFEEIYVDNKLFYTTEEQIGALSYYSSYVPFMGETEPLGIVNLPYFARQTEVKKAYYIMIFTFLNLFVIAGIIGIFIALLLSRFLTKPLVVLQQSLSEIRIDQKNERIAWESNDEIGLLIREYNQMVDKLEESAELLKHSERESAWREVARQIAHEIKNPLTPMKLNVQHLEKAYNENDPAQKEKIHSISQSLIQQIDTLDKVAEMFSDFAKSNIKRMEKVELLQIIKSSVLLFKNNENIQFTIKADEAEYHTKAIEKDVLRLFNNLIKNAVQSLEGAEDGKIDITLHRSGQFIEITIADNGKGIDKDIKSRVFQPYFTTKSGGTGLGLAIVKNIMNETGGDITFESGPTGTAFYLKFKNTEA